MPSKAELSVADWHRLNRLLEAALAVADGEARGAWLRRVPAEDEHLLPLLQQLLCKGNLTETAGFAGVPPWVDEPPRDDEQPGQRLGPYRLLRELGQGGMGTVWLAERADGAFERQVALKLPRAQWSDRGLAQRFARERAVLASLNHPHIAQLFDAGWSDSGRPYLALEYVEGLPIHQWCEQQRLDLSARLTLFVAVIRAVAHAHARLIVHRDLKPTNVLVSADGQVKLLDFGIAKLLAEDSAAAEETELTRLGGRALTPQYAAPEQILGKPISTATDIYSLGVVLFELLTDERPYRLASDARRSALEDAVVHADVPAPSALAKDTVTRRALRGDLDAIVLKALAKAPEQRYETAAAFADDIERHLARLPVRAQRAGRWYRLRRFVTRNRYSVAAVGAVVLALSAGLTAALWQAGVARGEAVRANLIKDFVLSIIQQADPVASRQTREADVALLTTAEERVQQELAKHPELALQMRRAIGAAYRNRGEFSRAAAVLRKGIEQARTALPPDNIELLGAMVEIAQFRVIDTRQATEDLESAIKILRQLGPDAQPMLADALLAHYLNTSWIMEWKQSVRTGREAYAAIRATGDVGRILYAASEIKSIFIDYLGHDPPGYLALISEAYELAMRSGRIEPSDPRRISAMARHAGALCSAGRKDEGLRLAQQALDEARRFHGADSFVTQTAYFELAMVWICRDDLKQALDPLRQAYAISSKRESPSSEIRLVVRGYLIHVLFDLGMRDEAMRVFREFSTQRPVPGAPSNAPGVPPVLLLIGEATAYLRFGDTEAAERLGEDAYAAIEAERAQIHTSEVAGVLADALYQNGKFDRADLFAQKALESDGQKAPPSAGRRAEHLLRLSLIRMERGQHQSALELVEQARGLLSENGAPSAHDATRLSYRRGRALLGLGRHREAVEALAPVHAYWSQAGSDLCCGAQGTAAATVAHWYGQALVGAGETARGRALVAQARPKLQASLFPRDRALAETPAPP